MIGIGSSVGHYVVRAKLGEGAMGTVYLGQHHVLDSRVAIKVIRREVERTEEDIARFFTEARAASTIGHDNIVSVLDFGRTKDGDPYYIMELLQGESLAARIARGRPGLAEVLHVGAQMADGLAASHAKGIVHRDLKPGNVFLVRRGSDAQFVKLLDFGVAKLTEEEAEQRGHRTNTGRLLGTPHYMAPEQVAGRRSVDGRADVYALGVVLFEMLCGQLPFTAPKWTEVLIQHVTEPAPRVRERWSECPAWLDRLVDRALAKTAQERPSMLAVRDALRAGDDLGLARAGGGGADATGDTLHAAVLPPTVRQRPESRASGETRALASADTVASVDKPVAPAPPPPRPRRVLLAAALALGLGGSALGAVYGVRALVRPDATAAAADAGVREAAQSPSDRMRQRADEIAAVRAALEAPDPPDAGVELAGLAEPPSPRPPKPRLRPLRPDAGVVLPESLDAFDVERALRGTRRGVASCNDRYAGVAMLELTLDVLGSGEVSSIDLGSEYVGTPFAMCVLHAIRDEAAFPPFSAAYQEIPYRYGFDLSR